MVVTTKTHVLLPKLGQQLRKPLQLNFSPRRCFIGKKDMVKIKKYGCDIEICSNTNSRVGHCSAGERKRKPQRKQQNSCFSTLQERS